MDVSILPLAGGMSMLLGGLWLMRYGLRRLFSPSLRRLLARLTVTPWRGMIAGTVGAALLQSSTALTLATVGLVSADYISFYQGLGLVLGANVGTCTTVGLLTLDLPPGGLLPLLAVCSIAALSIKALRPAALAIAGLLTMLTGLGFVAGALANQPVVTAAAERLALAGSKPLYGIGAGILLTFMFQSSSAATGLLMALADQGLVSLTAAAYGVYGNNIGSCLSSLVVAFAAPVAARRVAVAHVVLNFAGVAVFLPFTGCLTRAASGLTADFAGQIALIHTIFNLVSSLAVLPLARPYARLIVFLVPGDDGRI
ncbi:MAG TPA: Na/Pi symporter [Negativicutes bacterium]|nr:Na/Pi symporter [Negativicutes bacterium]